MKKNKKDHSVLHNLKIASPCKADWNNMTGDERIRFCGQCKLNVYNISQMTTEGAENLIKKKEGRICVRMFRRSDGTLINMDCPVGRLKKRLATACGAVSAMVSLFVLWVMQGRAAADAGFVQGEIAPGHYSMMGSLVPVRQQPKGEPIMEMGDVAVQAATGHDGMPEEMYLGGRHGHESK